LFINKAIRGSQGYHGHALVTPALLVAEVDDADALHRLGADICKPNQAGTTPLSRAEELGHEEAASMLRSLGATD
jgi:ankyrin repeat protein